MKMDDTDVILNVHMEAVPGHEEELAAQLQALVAPTHLEPGCLIYQLHRDPAEAGKFMFYERFVSQEALDSHTASPHLTRFREYRAAANPDPVAFMTVTKWRVFG
jgi:quinol monooxygenase YgiN